MTTGSLVMHFFKEEPIQLEENTMEQPSLSETQQTTQLVSHTLVDYSLLELSSSKPCIVKNNEEDFNMFNFSTAEVPTSLANLSA